jgi:hypothetical protein
MDYGHSLEFGYFLIPEAGDPRGVLEAARLADSNEAIVRPPDHWTEVLTHLALDLGFSTLVLIGKPIPRCCGRLSRTSPHGSASASRRRVPSRTADPLRRRSTVKDTHEEPRAGEA